MTEDKINGLLRAYDKLDAATSRVETALPEHMTAAILALKTERIAFRMLFQPLMSEALGKTDQLVQ